MAIDIVFRVPVRHDAIGERVETCHMECLDKQFVIVVGKRGKLVEIFKYSQCIEHDECEQRQKGGSSFFFLNLEYVEYLFHVFCFKRLSLEKESH